MERIDKFKHCPVCGQLLTLAPHEKECLLKCDACDFDFFLNPAPTVAAIIIKDNKIFLTKRANNPWRGLWEVPGGFVKKGETLEESLKREIHEELGVNIENVRYFASIPEPYTYNGITYSTLISYFKCTINEDVETNAEITDFGFFDFDSIPQIGSPAHQEVIDSLNKLPQKD